MLAKLGGYMHKTTTKSLSLMHKCIKNIHIRPNNLKLTEGKAENMHELIGPGRDSDQDPSSVDLGATISQWDLIKLKGFLFSKTPPFYSRGCPQNGKQITSYTCDRVLLSRTYKELKKLKRKQLN